MNNRMSQWTMVWVVVALVIGGLIGWFAYAGWTATSSKTSTSSTNSSDTVSLKSEQLNQAMRKLWEQHALWTRLYILGAVSSTPDKDQTLARLMQNQVDIGDAIKPYHGNAAGNQLTTLLKQHISLAGDVVTAAIANDQTALSQANTKWYANANDIADFLSNANPKLNKDDMRSMMKNHLDLTEQEAGGIIHKNSAASVSDYDKVENEILTMADALTTAITKQFPDKF